MALLQVLSEEALAEDAIHEYVDELYRIVCVAERPATADRPSTLMRTTYVVDWEQLVHLLEDYTVFGEDIVEVKALSGDEARVLRKGMHGRQTFALA